VPTANRALVLWGTRPGEAGPAGSVREAMDRALVLPGAQAVVLGDLRRAEPLTWAHRPHITERFALDGARGCLDLAATLREGTEELVVSGNAFLSLLQTTPLPTGGSAYMHLTLSRANANLALAAMGLRVLVGDLPRLLAAEPPPPPGRTPGREPAPMPTPTSTKLPRRGSGSPRPAPSTQPHSMVPLETIRMVLERLRLL